MEAAPIRMEVRPDRVAVLTLDRPPVNAMGRDVRERFLAAMDELRARDDVRAIVLTASGKVFCAGADIKEKRDLASTTPGDYARANRLTRDSFLALLEGGTPVIAAVNGACLGAGFVMAACCDFIVASETATFGMPEIDVGQGGGASFLQRIVPLPRLRRMLLTGERVSAQEMHRLGAVETCVPPGDLMPAALAVAATIAAKSPTAVRAIRASFETVGHLPLYEGFRLEQDYTTRLSTSADAAEARQAFLEKRAPRFS